MVVQLNQDHMSSRGADAPLRSSGAVDASDVIVNVEGKGNLGIFPLSVQKNVESRLKEELRTS